jgi:diguanylate cyclase (GGDEF)-like protein
LLKRWETSADAVAVMRSDRGGRVGRWATGAIVIGLVVHAAGAVVWPRGAAGENVVLDTWLYDALLVGSALLIGARARTAGSRRAATAAAALAVALWAAGDVYWTVAVPSTGEEPFPTIADALWLAFYPAAASAVVLLLRRELPRVRATVWLDALVVALGTGAVTAAAVAPRVGAATGDRMAVLVNLAYPVGDLMLFSLVAGVIVLFGFRPPSHWWMIAGGLATFAVVDSIYLVLVAHDSYAEGTLLDTLWPLALFLLAAARWGARVESHRRPVGGWASIALPFASAALSLAMLALDDLLRIPSAAVVLAALTLAAASARALVSFRDVLTLADSRKQARTDELTGLGNRRRLHEHLARAFGRDEPSLALLVVDLDRFKEINDTLGHPVGDELLRSIGPRLAGAVRSGEFVARLGGDEFAVVVDGPIDEAQARTVAARIRAAISAPFELDGMAVRIDASIGIAIAPQHGFDADTLLQRADIAMYQAKNARAGADVYLPDRDMHSRRRLERIERLRTAVSTGEIVVHYQPLCDITTGELLGMEALARWEHPEDGLLPPSEFVTLAEQFGLSRALTATVLDSALAACRQWRVSRPHIYVSVNLSPSDLLDAGLPDRVSAMLGSHGLPGDALVLEITENTLMSDPVRARETLGYLRRLGVNVAIDDFGTGYSSLAYLRELPVDLLKLDRSFVTGMDVDRHLRAIVGSTVGLAHSLGLRMVAEGVETSGVLERLAVLGADIGQGWFLGRPMTASAAQAWVEGQSPAPAETPRLAS